MKSSYKNPIVLYYMANWCYKHKVPIIPCLLKLLLFFSCSASVHYATEIGQNCLLGHGGSGVVIHKQAKIGNRVLICQQVTIGGTGIGTSMPVIGDDVYIGAGAKILGPVEVGSNCVIGANAVVVKSVPPGCVVAGVPARIIKQGIDAHAIEEW
jgi:serine O-acetyltransferase